MSEIADSSKHDNLGKKTFSFSVASGRRFRLSLSFASGSPASHPLFLFDFPRQKSLRRKILRRKIHRRKLLRRKVRREAKRTRKASWRCKGFLAALVFSPRCPFVDEVSGGQREPTYIYNLFRLYLPLPEVLMISYS